MNIRIILAFLFITIGMGGFILITSADVIIPFPQYSSILQQSLQPPSMQQIYSIQDGEPLITASFGEPKNNYFLYQNNQWYVGIGANTPVSIHAEDQGNQSGVGIEYLYYEIYTAQICGNCIYQYSDVRQDNHWPDINSLEGVITCVLFMNESCWYKLHYWAYDKLEYKTPTTTSSYLSTDFLIDAKKPVTKWTYTNPHYVDAVDLLGNLERVHYQVYRVDNSLPEIHITQGEPNVSAKEYYWVNRDTAITINVQNQGYCPFFTVQFRLNQGSWYTITHQLPFKFIFPDECIYELDVMAVDVVNQVDRSINRYYVNDTSPHVNIIKSVNSWYMTCSSLAAIPLATDEPNHNTPCNDERAIGIGPSHHTDAFLLDPFPSFKYVLLNGSNCVYDANQGKFLGNLIISRIIPIENDPVLFRTLISDDLGNTNNTLAKPYNLFLETNSDEIEINQLIQPLLNTHQINYIGRDTTPVVTITQPLSGSMIRPGVVAITVSMQDTLSGINADTACYITPQSTLVGIVKYDPTIGGCNGTLEIPKQIQSRNIAPLTISTTDIAGNIGPSCRNTPPVGCILSPLENGIYSTVLPVQIHAHDAETPTTNLHVVVEINRQGDPSFFYNATYDPKTNNFTARINISTYTNGTILRVNARITDEAGSTVSTLPIHCSIRSPILFDQWMMVGWNLINISHVGTNTTIDHVFHSILGYFDYIFDSTTWDNYKYGRPANTLTSAHSSTWYWINMLHATRFYLTETK